MADVSSTLISNRAALPRVANDPWTNARLKTTGPGIVEVSTSEDVGDILNFAYIPSNALVHRVLLSCDAIAATGAMDIGLYRTADDGGAAVDVDLFADGQVVTAALKNSDVTHESGIYGIEDKNKPLWEALNLSEDPNVTYVIAGTITADMGGAGTIVVAAEYVDGGS